MSDSSRKKSPSRKRKAPKSKSAEALSSPTKTVVCKNFFVKKFQSIKKIFRKKDTSSSSTKSTKSSSRSSSTNSSKKQTPSKSDPKSEKSRPDPNLALERWISHCFGSNMVAPRNSMNMLFAPIPSMEAYVAMLVAMRTEQRKVMRGVFFVNEEYCEFVAARLKKQSPLPPHEAHHLFRLITDDAENTLVNEKYIKMMQDYFGPTTIVCCRPQSSTTYLSNLTGGLVKDHSGLTGWTIGFCSGAISAKWEGKTSVAVWAPFATSFADRQEHAFFRLSTKAKTVRRHGFEAWSLPLLTDSKTRFRLILLRPVYIGSMLEMRQKMTPTLLRKLQNDLNAQEENDHRILLPFFSLNLDDDLWKRWSNNFKGPFSSINNDDPPFPRMGNIWHRAVFSLTPEGAGVSFRYVSNRALPTSVKAYCDNPKLVRSKPHYSMRFDSPFIFLITSEGSNGIPLLSGSYAGSPAAEKKRISIPIPPRIAAKPPQKSEKMKKKKKKKSQMKKELSLRKHSQRRRFWDKIKGIFKKSRSTEKSEKGRKSEKSKRAQKSERSRKERKSEKSSKKERKREAKGTWV